jgi:2-dehydropantoate 2-reductase
MRIGVFGAGSVGAYYGGRLAQTGEDVVFIARGAHLAALRTGGLRVDSISGDFRVDPVQATDDPAEVGAVDIVLLGVKAWSVPEAAEAMRPLIGPQTGVIPLGNGVDAPDQLAAVLGREHVLGGLTRISAMIAAPGYIRHVGIDPVIAFGELDGSRSARVERLLEAFGRTTGVKASVPADIQAAMWEKFVFIAAVSGLGGVTRAPIGVFRSQPGTRHMLEGALQEVVAIAQARGVQISSEVAGHTLARIDDMQPGVMASMQRDIMEGRPSELEAQNGAVVRMGREAGVPTPVHDFLYASLLPQELKARGEISF